MRNALEYALHTGTVIHLVGGSDVEADVLAEEVRAATDSEMLRVACTPATTAEELPSARVPKGILVYYRNFGELPSDVQGTAAQCVKGHFEFGIPVVVRSSDESRGDLTLGNGDLRGRVRTIELDDAAEERIEK